MSGYRARHHKYFRHDVPADARDVVLQRHQDANRRVGAVAPVPVPSSAVEQAAEPGRPVANYLPQADAATVIGKLIVGREQQWVADKFVAFAETLTAPVEHHAAPALQQAAEKPYVPIRAPGRRIASLRDFGPGTVLVEQIGPTPAPTVVPLIPIAVSPDVDPTTIKFLDAGGQEVGRIVNVAEESAPAPTAADVTLADLPIGKADFEYLSGTAGTGKTYTSKQLLELSPKGTVVLAATTGIASVNLGEGTTIHSLLGFFNTADLQEKFQTGRLQRTLRMLARNGLRRILIDEVSMMDGRVVTILTRAVAEANQPRDRALESIGLGEGGDVDYEDGDESAAGDLPPQLALTLVGDFAQLPPVPDEDQTGAKIPATFAFESPEWSRYAAHTHKLEKIWRQTDLPFVQALHAVRRGDPAAAMRFFTADKFSPTTDLSFDGTTIFAKNVEVDRHNQLRLDEIKSEPLYFPATRWGKPRNDWKQIPDRLTLKVGALVMVLANRRVADGPVKSLLYANGDLGELVARKADGICQVRLKRTGRVVDVVQVVRENQIPCSGARRKEIKEYEQRVVELQTQRDAIAESLRRGVDTLTELPPPEIDEALALDPTAPAIVWPPVLTDERRAVLRRQLNEIEVELQRPRPCGFLSEDGKSEVIGTVTYMPLRVAYAATVHKTQGLTLDRIQVNIRDGFFKQPGMLFVALSRARTPEGLRIVGDPRAFMERCRVDGRVVRWL